jgi:exonuclease SbcC
MIQELRLKNFQRHKDLQVTFGPHITAIVGQSDTGKSAIIRAIRWLVEHRPISGLSTHGTDDTRVGIKTDKGLVIRFKDKKNYGYSVNGQKYLATGTQQPVPVSQLLAMEDINFQGQHDPVFLLSLTPGQMAKELNRIVDLSVIDESMAEINSRVTKTKAQVTAYQEEEARLVKGVEELLWVQEAVDKLTALDERATKLESAECRHAALEIKVLRLTESDAKLQKYREMEDWLSLFVETVRQYREHCSRRDSLKKVVDGILNRKFPSKKFYDAIESLLARAETVAQMKQKRDRLAVLVAQAKSCNSSIAIKDTEISQTQSQIKEIPVCPSCNRPL